MENIQKKCLFSGALFTPKSIIQVFACKKNQIAYNNLLAKQKREIKSKYDKPLDRNRNVLKKILGNNKEIIKSKDFLTALEYNFSLSNYMVLIDKEKNIAACGVYEFLIMPIESNNYKITKYATLFGNK